MEGVIINKEIKRTVRTHNREFAISGCTVQKCLIEMLKKNNIDIKDDSIIVLMFDGREVYGGDYFYLTVNNEEEGEE